MAGALAGRVAVVTGGGWNVGRAVALRFAREGARVVVAARRQEPLRETVEAIRAEGGEARAVPTDVTDWPAVRRLAEETARAFGTVDVLAALAGGGGEDLPIDEVDPARWEEVVRVNLLGTFHAVRAVVPTLKDKGAGTIVTCAGGGASFPQVGAHATAYASAKAGICRFTDQLAVELLESGVRVNCLLPGPTPPRPPEEAAELAAWLASEASAPLTGRTVAAEEDWWRDPRRVGAVQASLHACCLRRQEPV